MTRRILFVGENQPLWDDFRAYCSGPDSAWTADFASSGFDALGLVGQRSFEAIVANVQLPDMQAADFLDEVMRWQPKSFRILLSDLSDTAGTVQCLGKSHRHMVKPCDTTTLLSALNEAIVRESWLPTRRAQGLIAQLRKVPSPPAVYFRVASEMQTAEASVEVVGNLIGEDPALAAKMLQLANSAAFALKVQVSNPVEAVSYLGLETTRAVILLAHTFSSFERVNVKGFSVDRLCHHSVCTSRFARRIMLTEAEGPEEVEQVSAAGLLHDIGKLVFAANMPEEFSQAMILAGEQKCPLWEAENRILGASHAEVGACLLGIWGLPRPVIEAVALHHIPQQSMRREFGPALVVCAANLLACEAWPENRPVAPEGFNKECFEEPDLAARLEKWRHLCLTATTSAAAAA